MAHDFKIVNSETNSSADKGFFWHIRECLALNFSLPDLKVGVNLWSQRPISELIFQKLGYIKKIHEVMF